MLSQQLIMVYLINLSLYFMCHALDEEAHEEE